jgi:hypothetical protein
MAKQKSPHPATEAEIEQARAWLANWLKECVKRAALPRPTPSITGVFGPNGEPPDHFSIGAPEDAVALLAWAMDQQRAMPRRILETWLFEAFDSRQGLILAECEKRGWITQAAVIFDGGRHECYRVRDAVAIAPRRSSNDEICEFVHKLRTKSDPVAFDRLPPLIKSEFGREMTADSLKKAYARWKRKRK